MVRCSTCTQCTYRCRYRCDISASSVNSSFEMWGTNRKGPLVKIKWLLPTERAHLVQMVSIKGFLLVFFRNEPSYCESLTTTVWCPVFIARQRQNQSQIRPKHGKGTPSKYILVRCLNTIHTWWCNTPRTENDIWLHLQFQLHSFEWVWGQSMNLLQMKLRLNLRAVYFSSQCWILWCKGFQKS